MIGRLLIGLTAVGLAAGALWLAGSGRSAPPPAEQRERVSVVLVTHGSSVGSGWVLDADRGLVVTASHVVNGVSTVDVTRGGSRSDRARVVAASPCQDIALIALPNPRGLKDVPLGEQGTLRSGQSLITFGYAAEAGGPRWTTIYSATRDPRVAIGPRVYRRDTPALRDLVETGGAIEHGMSGGPTVDERGRLIGMAFASYTVPGENPVGFHVGVDVLRDALAKFKAGVAPGWAGSGLFFRRASRRPRGVVVTGLPGVRRGGYTHGGVLVTEVNGQPVGTTFASWCRAVQTLPPARATLTIRQRPGGEPERVVTTINRPLQP